MLWLSIVANEFILRTCLNLKAVEHVTIFLFSYLVQVKDLKNIKYNDV